MPKKLRRLPPALFVASNEISCGFAVTAGFSIELFYIPCSHPRTPPHSLFFSLRPRPVNGQPSTPSLPCIREQTENHEYSAKPSPYCIAQWPHCPHRAHGVCPFSRHGHLD